MSTIKLEEPGSTRDSFSGSTLGFADQLNNNQSKNMEDNKCTLAGIVVVAVVSFIAIILAAVALSKSNDNPTINVTTGSSDTPSAGGGSNPSAGGGELYPSNGKRIYTIAIGHDWGAHNYFDKEGYITGFTKDVISEVCQAAGIDCRTVWDKWANCWDSAAGEHGSGGQGLMDRWYDACSGWAVTVDRSQVFNFGIPYLVPYNDKFFVKKGASFNPKDITNKKMGFLDGWATDEKCIARQSDITGNVIPTNLITHYTQVEDAVNGLINGEVDALAGDEHTFQKWIGDSIEAKGEFACVLGGSTIMARKDSDLISIWNEGFQKLKNSGRFSKLCTEAQDNHGDKGDIPC